MKRPSGWQSPAVVLGLALAAGGLMFPRLLFGGDVVSCLDAGRMTLPLKRYFAERLGQGQLPLWFPYDGLGTSFLASALAQTFHPLTWLHLVLPTGPALTTELLANLLLALAGTFWLGRVLGATRAGAGLAAAGVALSGSLISTMESVQLLSGPSAFPLWLAGLHQAASAPAETRWKGGVLATLALGWAALGGDYQGVYLFGLFAMPWLLGLGVAPWGKALKTAAATSAAGLCLSAAQLAPTVEILGEVRRTSGLPWEESSARATHPLRLAELFVADLLRFVPSRAPGELNLNEWLNGPYAPWHSSIYLGATILLGVVWAATLPSGPRRRNLLTLAILGAVLLLLALGAHGGLYRVFYAAVPLWRSFRYPEKLLSYAVTPLCALAGLGLAAAQADPARAWRRGGWLLLGTGALGAVLCLVCEARAAAGSLGWLYLRRLGEGALRTGGIVAVATALVGAASRQRLSRLGKLGPSLVVGLALVDLCAVNARSLAMCLGPPDLLDRPNEFAKTLDHVAGHRPGAFRVTTQVVLRMGGLPEVEALGGASYLGATAWDYQSLASDYAALVRVESSQAYLPSASGRLQGLSADRRWGLEYAPLFNGVYLVTNLSARADPRLERVDTFAEYDLALSRLPHALPRTFVASARPVASADEARAALDLPGVRAGVEAAVEQASAEGGAPAQAPGVARLASYAPERVEIAARLERPGIVVLNDAYAPGWEVTVDDAPQPLLRTNYLVRGVRVPPGEHRVVFTFPPSRGVRLGVAISLLSVLGLLAFSAVRGLRSRREA